MKRDISIYKTKGILLLYHFIHEYIKELSPCEILNQSKHNSSTNVKITVICLTFSFNFFCQLYLFSLLMK